MVACHYNDIVSRSRGRPMKLWITVAQDNMRGKGLVSKVSQHWDRCSRLSTKADLAFFHARRAKQPGLTMMNIINNSKTLWPQFSYSIKEPHTRTWKRLRTLKISLHCIITIRPRNPLCSWHSNSLVRYFRIHQDETLHSFRRNRYQRGKDIMKSNLVGHRID